MNFANFLRTPFFHRTAHVAASAFPQFVVRFVIILTYQAEEINFSGTKGYVDY